MSELDRDWIQRDLDEGATWDDGDPQTDVVSELRAMRFAIHHLGEEPTFSR